MIKSLSLDWIKLMVIAFLLLTPLSLGYFAGPEIPINIIIALMGILYVGKNLKDQGVYLFFVILTVSISTVYSMLVYTTETSIRDVLSPFYILLPLFSVFFGREISRKYGIKNIIPILSGVSSACLIWIVSSILISGKPVRYTILSRTGSSSNIGDVIGGNIFGGNLYASWGVLSLALYFLILTSISFMGLMSKRLIPLSILGILSGVYLTIESSSRTVLLSLYAFAFFLILLNLKGSWRQLFIIISALSISLLLILIQIGIPEFALSHLPSAIRRSVLLFSQGGIDAVSSGRTYLYEAAIKDIEGSPLFGVGATGFKNIPALASADVLATFTQGWTPHNFYLTIVWKYGFMGLVSILAFYLIPMTKLIVRRNSFYARVVASIVFAILTFGCFTWDSLLVFGISTVVCFLIGLFEVSSDDRINEIHSSL